MIPAVVIRALVTTLLRRRAVLWIGGAWALLGPLFGMVVPYLVAASGGMPPDVASTVVATVLPAALPATVVAGYTPYGGAYLVLLGAVLVGNEYRWGTVATLLVQRASRTGVVLAHAAALAMIVGLVVGVEYIVSAVTALGIAAAEGVPAAAPGAAAVAGSLAAAWLAGLAFAALGVLLAHLLRGAAGAVGVGLVWVLGLETAVRGLLTLIPGLAWLGHGLLGPAVGALAVAVGAAPVDAPFGVGAGGSAAVAVAVLAAWTLLAALLAAAVIRHRDVPAS